MTTINYIKAGYAGLAIKTTEESRTMAELRLEANENGYTFATWDTGGTFYTFAPYATSPETSDADGPIEALGKIGELPEKAIIAIPDFDLIFKAISGTIGTNAGIHWNYILSAGRVGYRRVIE